MKSRHKNNFIKTKSQPGIVKKAHSDLHRRETCDMWNKVCTELHLEEWSENPHRRETTQADVVKDLHRINMTVMKGNVWLPFPQPHTLCSNMIHCIIFYNVIKLINNWNLGIFHSRSGKVREFIQTSAEALSNMRMLIQKMVICCGLIK